MNNNSIIEALGVVTEDLLNIQTDVRYIMRGMDDGEASPETMDALRDIASAAASTKAVLLYLAEALDATNKTERAIAHMTAAAACETMLKADACSRPITSQI